MCPTWPVTALRRYVGSGPGDGAGNGVAVGAVVADEVLPLKRLQPREVTQTERLPALSQPGRVRASLDDQGVAWRPADLAARPRAGDVLTIVGAAP